MTFRNGSIDYRVEHPDSSGELPAWVKPEPWCGQTVFVFATAPDAEDDEARAGISEAAREISEAARAAEEKEDGKAEACEATAEAGEQIVSTPQPEADSLFAVEEVNADAETVRPLDDRTGEGKSRGESEAKETGELS